MLLGSTSIKAACKTLVKLTPDNFQSQLGQTKDHFSNQGKNATQGVAF